MPAETDMLTPNMADSESDEKAIEMQRRFIRETAGKIDVDEEAVNDLRSVSKDTFHCRNVNLDNYSHRTERGQHVDEYMHETRNNDRV